MSLTSTISKESLLEILVRNRAEHETAFNQASEKYRDYLKEQLMDVLGQLNRGEKVDIWSKIKVTTPTSHLSDYDTAIEMVQNSEDDIFHLDFNDYSRFVKDQWPWRSKFDSDNAAYSTLV